MANIGDNIEAKLGQLVGWQYLNVATFIGVCVIIGLMIL